MPSCRAPEQYHLLDLRGPFVNLVDFGVAHQLFDRVFPAVAVALRRPVPHRWRSSWRHQRRTPLATARGHRVSPSRFHVASRLQCEVASGLNSNRHVRQHEADALKVGDWLAERSSLAGIGYGLVKGPARHPDCGYGNARPASVEGLHADFETVAFFHQAIACRHFDIIEEDLAGLGGVLAHLLERLADADAGPVPFPRESS